MDLKTLQTEMARLQAITAKWQTSEDITPIERDLALERLRAIYEALLFELTPAEPMPSEEPEETAAEVPAEALPADEEPEPITPIDAAAFLSLDSLLMQTPAEEEKPAEEPETEPEPETKEEQENTPAAEEEPESAPEMAAVEEQPAAEAVEAKPAAKEEAQPVVEPQEEPAEKAQPVVEEPAKPMAHNLFGVEEATVRHRHKQRVIMSLYDAVPEPAKRSEPELKIETLLPRESEVIVVEAEPEVIEVSEEELLQPVVAPKVAPAVAEEPKSEPAVAEPTFSVVEAAAAQPVQPEQPAQPEPAQPTLADTLPHVQTLGEKLAAEQSADVRREPVTDLRRAVSFNDKFLLIQELFNGNGSLYEITIRRLNEFDNFDDCMIYIAEHFAWNPNSDGAKLMMDLLERKFLQ